MRDAIRPANLTDMGALCCLIVDDNTGFLESARLLLEREGLRVVAVASTCEDALLHIETLRPDVVLIDVDLGHESGFDVVRSLQDRFGPSTPDLILISIDAEQDLAELIAETPVLGFIPKTHLSAEAIHALRHGRSHT
jgi:DNA-binding NarL/FixJ family response regulator